MVKRTFTLTTFAAALLLVLGLMASAVTVSAQDGTPDVRGDVTAEIDRHPAHIHSGTCQELGDVVYPLNDLQAAQQVPESAATPSPEASPAADDLAAQSNSEVEASLDDLLAEEHAINVHQSEDEIGTYIACGDLTGEPTDGELTIELQELNNSGYVGEATLTESDEGTIIVHVSLFPSDAVDEATPVATPAS